MRRQNTGPCAYCGTPAQEVEHVFGRQFFPAEGNYRNDLVRVPACSNCNRAKQRAEDVAGVLIPFTGESNASMHVLMERIPRTLAKNKKLADNIILREDYFKNANYKFDKRTVLVLNDWLKNSLLDWYIYIVQGLFMHEFNANLTKDKIHVFHKNGGDYNRFRDILFSRISSEERIRALGEINYRVSISEDKSISMWSIRIYGDEVVAITGHLTNQENRQFLHDLEWKHTIT